ncbi:hypothetical protein [Streptococcus pyogenes]|uniref:hypothetical protein n=1 Tax=Streptococcus pyogenes TaxID=1314 RepID=UPI0010D0EB6D|nr:hypothetical protein [Streptococcus pyogenes]VGV34764.1 Uncharacterised protein [Streptococcus pyogenes]VHA93419.1 Uncharacterised protein [Streptococcus pyogenes]
MDNLSLKNNPLWGNPYIQFVTGKLINIKKSVSDLAAALLLSAFAAIDSKVKADETARAYRYDVSEQNTYYQTISSINQQRPGATLDE